jgi:hypothetical protein
MVPKAGLGYFAHPFAYLLDLEDFASSARLKDFFGTVPETISTVTRAS